MRLVLHIGMGKTGTSTLQQTMGRQRKVLAKEGVFYPRSDRVPFRHHQALMCLVARPEQLPREFARLGANNAAEVRAAGERFWEDVVQQAKAARARTVVLSYESLLYLEDQQVERLREILADVFDEIDVAAYVRHPSSHWLSRTQQGVKSSFTVTPPGRYHNSVGLHLERWLRCFDGRVTARAFDTSVLHGGCIVQDFLATHLPDAPSLPDRIVVMNVNESISAEAMCVLADFHRYGWPEGAPLFGSESAEVLDMLRHVGTQVPQTRPTLRPEIARVLVDNHRGELEWLASNFGMEFPSWSGSDAAVAPDLETAGACQELRQLLVVDPEQVDRTLHALLRELATRSITLRTMQDPRTEPPGADVRAPRDTTTGAESGSARSRLTGLLARASERRPG